MLRGGVVLLASAALAACGGGSGKGGGGGTPGPGGPGAGTQFIIEDFLDAANLDASASDADWASSEVSILKGQPVTTRNAYVYAYEEMDSGSNSGRGQYVRIADPLTGADLGVLPGTLPPTNQGRRMVMSISDTKLGEAGAITGVSWGPHENRTNAATYPNLRIRAGYRNTQLSGSLGLAATVADSYEGQPTLLYDGAYTVPASTVTNPVGEPTTPHVGGYPQGGGCIGPVAGWNEQAFTYTGWYPYPALTNFFDWDPGNPAVANDRVLLIDVSVQEGDVHQDMRSWFAVTFPCSAILIGGYPEQTLFTTYEASLGNPQDNFPAGIINPGPAMVDTCISFTRRRSVGQSKFYLGAFGDDTDYNTPAIVPATQTNGASILVEYQGADSVSGDGVTINTAAPFTGWVTDIDQCDGMRYIRFRITLNSDIVNLNVARVDSISIGMTDSNP
ncbi:MAG: hypothetical protein QNJ98_05990 [Planctomycetota bacterium]|nr:hypothetical protein [Planctomycetota bacterium]